MKGKLLRINLQHLVHMGVKLLISYGNVWKTLCGKRELCSNLRILI